MAKVIVTIYNGILESVISDQEGLEVLIVEHDKYADLEDLYLVDDNKVRLSEWEADYAPQTVTVCYEKAKEAKDAPRCDHCQGPRAEDFINDESNLTGRKFCSLECAQEDSESLQEQGGVV